MLSRVWWYLALNRKDGSNTATVPFILVYNANMSHVPVVSSVSNIQLKETLLLTRRRRPRRNGPQFRGALDARLPRESDLLANSKTNCFIWYISHLTITYLNYKIFFGCRVQRWNSLSESIHRTPSLDSFERSCQRPLSQLLSFVSVYFFLRSIVLVFFLYAFISILPTSIY